MKNIIFFGPPGAGKGTQAKEISKHFQLAHLSTGDILRSKIQQEDDLANQLKDIMSSGKLVSDEILNKIVAEKLIDASKDGFILDGYPRTLEQSKFLNDFLNQKSIEINFIFSIQLDFRLLKERILKRAKEENRDDDNIDVIETRYQKYIDTTKKVSDFYKINYSQIFNEINGNDEIEKITSKIIKILKN